MFYYIGVSATREKKQTGERQKDRKIYKRKKVSRKIYMMKEKEDNDQKVLLTVMRTKARGDDPKEASKGKRL